MSKYTTEVRFICENAYNNENSGFTSIDTILNTVAPKIFNFDFPIFDEQYRIPLETKILRTYYTREICEETVGLWKLRLQNKLCNIMPYYNQLYESAKLKFDVFKDVDYIEVINGTTHNSLNKTVNFENLGGADTTTYLKQGKEKNTTAYNGGSVNTVDYSGKEKNIINYEGSETNSTNYNGSEKTNNTTSGNISKTPPTKITTKSDTPQGGLNGLISDDYLTTAQKEMYTSDEIEKYNNLTNNSEKTFAGRNDTATKNFNNRNDNETKSFENRKDTTTNQYLNRNDINTLEFENRSDIAEQEKFSKNKTDESNTSWNKNDNTLRVTGKKNGLTYAEMLKQYRQTFLNIDKMIIDELSDLFFQLW